MNTNISLMNRAELDFGSLSQGVMFICNNNLYIVSETFEDDGWTNAILLNGYEAGKRCNFCDNTRVIPLKEVKINFEI